MNETEIVYTTAPQAADYEWTVKESTDVRVKTPWKAEPQTFRRVALDTREARYYSEYQKGRYRSGWLVMSEEQWERDVASGYLTVLPE